MGVQKGHAAAVEYHKHRHGDVAGAQDRSYDASRDTSSRNTRTLQRLKNWQEQEKNPLVIDVRPKSELDLAHLPFAKALFEMSEEEIASLKKDQAIVFLCHHGRRSQQAAESWRARGFTNLYNLTGGIDAWSRKIDRSVPVY